MWKFGNLPPDPPLHHACIHACIMFLGITLISSSICFSYAFPTSFTWLKVPDHLVSRKPTWFFFLLTLYYISSWWVTCLSSRVGRYLPWILYWYLWGKKGKMFFFTWYKNISIMVGQFGVWWDSKGYIPRNQCRLIRVLLIAIQFWCSFGF